MPRHPVKDDIPVGELRSYFCCINRCLLDHPVENIQNLRFAFQCKTRWPDRKQFLLDRLSEFQQAHQPGRYKFTLNGRSMCDKAWVAAQGMKIAWFNKVKAQHREGDRTAIHGNTLRPDAELARVDFRNGSITTFVRNYIKDNCEPMPNSDQFHLPSATYFTDVYHDFMCSVGKPVETTACLTDRWFYKIVKRLFPNLKKPREKRFSKCDKCCQFVARLRKMHYHDETLLAEIRQERSWHMTRQRNQRYAFAHYIALSLEFPSKYLCLSTDGMDQAKTFLPQTKLNYKSLSSAYKLKVHVMGSMVFGRSLTCFYDICEYPHDTNLNLTVIMDTLWENRDNLPPHIHIQLDNTGRENKNQYFFRFLAALVQSKRIRKITIGFLLVVDQYFSRLSHYIGRQYPGVFTFEDLERAISNCWKTNVNVDINEHSGLTSVIPVAKRFQKLMAYREWILPCSAGVPLSFVEAFFYRIGCNEDNIACLYARQGAERECRETVGIPLLGSSLPTKYPEVISPNYDKVCFTSLETTIKLCYGKHVFSEQDEATWTKFIADERATIAEWAKKKPVTYQRKRGKKEPLYADDIHKVCHNYYVNPDTFSVYDLLPIKENIEYQMEEQHVVRPDDDWYNPPEMFWKNRDAKRRRAKLFGDVLQERDRTGQTVAIRPTDPNDDPWIGEVMSEFRPTKVDGKPTYEFYCRWYRGYEDYTYTDALFPSRKKIDTEIQYLHSIIAFQLKMTKRHVLTQASLRRIDEKMEEIRKDENDKVVEVENVLNPKCYDIGYSDNEADSDEDEDGAGPSYR